MGSNSTANNDVIYRKPFIKSTQFFQLRKKNNLCMKRLKSTDLFTSFIAQKTLVMTQPGRLYWQFEIDLLGQEPISTM